MIAIIDYAFFRLFCRIMILDIFDYFRHAIFSRHYCFHAIDLLSLSSIIAAAATIISLPILRWRHCFISAAIDIAAIIILLPFFVFR
jgi:hypothetical protein